MLVEIIDNVFYINNKEINELDSLVIDFVSVLDKHNIKYVIISGYVAIIFGRSRNSEDVDLFIEKMDYDTFKKIWIDLNIKFECIIEDDVKDAFFEYLNQGLPLRFAKKDTFIPNMEIKYPKDKLDIWSIRNRKEIKLNKQHSIFISPLELQIAYKLYLGGEKDIEDAKYIYNQFKNNLDNKLLDYFLVELKVMSIFRKYLL
ncbi:MAG TPA: hypothetical protein P5530_03270 [Candidatus Diapherotrites archaeon]|mgnify:CR=1 FL=1|nr:hypothetical protein [Candidatus Diapherotrites archaeon]